MNPESLGMAIIGRILQGIAWAIAACFWLTVILALILILTVWPWALGFYILVGGVAAVIGAIS